MSTIERKHKNLFLFDDCYKMRLYFDLKLTQKITVLFRK